MSLFTISSEPDKQVWPMAVWRSYLVWYLLALLLACALVAGINAVVDPQARILLVDKAGFNQVKLAMETNNRKGKANALRQCDYDTIVLGTSRAETAISVDRLKQAGARPYNAAMKAASMYEMRRIAEYALDHQDLKTVLIGLDFMSFSDHEFFVDDFADSPLAESFPLASLLRYLISTQTLYESWVTVRWNSSRDLKMCLDTGEYKRVRDTGEARLAIDFILRRYARGQYDKYLPGNEQLAHLTTLLQEFQVTDVKVYAYISPIHVTHIELMKEMGLLNEFEDWKRNLTAIFSQANSNVTGQQKFELWDFSGYNAVTTELVPLPEQAKYMRWFIDSAHVNQDAGNLVVDRMFNVSSDVLLEVAPFGVLLTADNVEAVIEAGRSGSEQYRRDNAAEIERLQQMLRSER